ncbi:Translation initiation factor 2 subunit alpha [Bienertia sinuspersici]
MDSPIVQQACMQPFCHDQQGSSQLSHTSEQSHLLDQYMNLNDYSLEDLFSGSCNDHINRSFLDDYKLSHFPSQEASSSWFPTAQSMVEEGHKYYMDSSYNPDMVMQSKSTPSVNALDCVETKDVWKILAGHDEAVVKKGKFPC